MSEAFDFDAWMKTVKIVDSETGIVYDGYDEMVASWGWKRRLRESVADFWNLRVKAPIRNLVWWFKYRLQPKHQYHIIRTGLRPGYHDVCTLMPVAIVKLFKDYIEIEKPFEWFDTEDSSNKAQWDSIKRLYAYFKDIDPMDPPHEKLRFPFKGTNGDFKAYDLVYRIREERFTRNLCEVVRLHKHYWT